VLLLSRTTRARAARLEIGGGLALLLALAAAGCAKVDLAAPKPVARKDDCSPQHAAQEAAAVPPPVPQKVAARTSTADELRRGSALFQSYGCVLCHGPQGRGDGRIAATLRTPPRDLRDLAAFEQGTSVAAIAATIEHGIARSGMPAHAFVPPPERELLARYILSLNEGSKLSQGGP
jgi:mono/diheme cytochrome c family protein